MTSVFRRWGGHCPISTRNNFGSRPHLRMRRIFPQNGPFSQVRVHMHRLVLVLWSTYLDACPFITPLLLLVLLLLTKMKCTVPIPHRSQLMLTDDKNQWKLGAYWLHWELLHGARVGWQLFMYPKTTRTENYAYEKWPSYQIKNCSVLAAVCSPQVGFSAGSSLTLPLLSGPEKEIQHFRRLPTNVSQLFFPFANQPGRMTWCCEDKF